ncbi:MAG: hypothetical protein HY657_20035, partial [Acidobacteria bacterium]|nr:hypothetical protein [Acidobacteriota bacterium]
MTRWWRSHSVRVRLTLWYLATMAIVLGVYAAAISAFVGRSESEALDRQLRRDFQWILATIYYTPDGMVEWSEPEFSVELVAPDDLPWFQIWHPETGELLFHSS